MDWLTAEHRDDWRAYLREHELELWARDARGFRRSARAVPVYYDAGGRAVPHAFVMRSLRNRMGGQYKAAARKRFRFGGLLNDDAT